MFEGIKKYFKDKFTWESKPPTKEIDGLKVMSIEEIVADNKAFDDPWFVVRYLYTKDKERDTTKPIGYIGKTLDKRKRG